MATIVPSLYVRNLYSVLTELVIEEMRFDFDCGNSIRISTVVPHVQTPMQDPRESK